jgi:dUTP pyrophosphatase
MTSFTAADFLNNLNNNSNKNINECAVLKLFVNSDNNELRSMYQNHVNSHNNSVLNSTFPNSGFDLFVPQDVVFNQEVDSKFLDMDVQCELLNSNNRNSAFYLYPRSSISKTPLMLANHVGIIDSGYRGKMIGAFRWLNSQEHHESEYIVSKGTRLLQICHPSLCPILVKIVDSFDELSTTERGAGGFGSTGR